MLNFPQSIRFYVLVIACHYCGSMAVIDISNNRERQALLEISGFGRDKIEPTLPRDLIHNEGLEKIVSEMLQHTSCDTPALNQQFKDDFVYTAGILEGQLAVRNSGKDPSTGQAGNVFTIKKARILDKVCKFLKAQLELMNGGQDREVGQIGRMEEIEGEAQPEQMSMADKRENLATVFKGQAKASLADQHLARQDAEKQAKARTQAVETLKEVLKGTKAFLASDAAKQKEEGMKLHETASKANKAVEAYYEYLNAEEILEELMRRGVFDMIIYRYAQDAGTMPSRVYYPVERGRATLKPGIAQEVEAKLGPINSEGYVITPEVVDLPRDISDLLQWIADVKEKQQKVGTVQDANAQEAEEADAADQKDGDEVKKFKDLWTKASESLIVNVRVLGSADTADKDETELALDKGKKGVNSEYKWEVALGQRVALRKKLPYQSENYELARGIKYQIGETKAVVHCEYHGGSIPKSDSISIADSMPSKSSWKFSDFFLEVLLVVIGIMILCVAGWLLMQGGLMLASLFKPLIRPLFPGPFDLNVTYKAGKMPRPSNYFYELDWIGMMLECDL